MTMVDRLAAWVWDNLPGGVPVQLWVWRLSPWLAGWLELLAHLRDRERELMKTDELVAELEQLQREDPFEWARLRMQVTAVIEADREDED